MAAIYRLLAPFPTVQRVSDGAFIPPTQANPDFREFVRWLFEEGGEPDTLMEVPALDETDTLFGGDKWL